MNRAALVACSLSRAASRSPRRKKKETKLFASNEKEGVSIQGSAEPGQGQLWEARRIRRASTRIRRSSSRTKIDLFTIEVNVQRKEGKDPLREDGRSLFEIAKDVRSRFTTKEGDQEPNWKECILNNEDQKAKLNSVPGAACSHKITLVDRTGAKHNLTQYFIICSDVLYIVTIKYTMSRTRSTGPRKASSS